MGAVDLRPSKASGWAFTEEQFEALRELMGKMGLRVVQADIFNGENRFYCFRSGIDYVYKIVEA